VPPTIPSGPAWAVAIGLIFTGLALLIKASVPIVQAIRKNNNHAPRFQPNGDAERRTNTAVREVILHIDRVQEVLIKNQLALLQDLKETRHDILAPLKIVVDGMQREIQEIHAKVGA